MADFGALSALFMRSFGTSIGISMVNGVRGSRGSLTSFIHEVRNPHSVTPLDARTYLVEMRLDVSREVWRDTRRHRARETGPRDVSRDSGGPLKGHKCGVFRPKKGPSSG